MCRRKFTEECEEVVHIFGSREYVILKEVKLTCRLNDMRSIYSQTCFIEV